MVHDPDRENERNIRRKESARKTERIKRSAFGPSRNTRRTPSTNCIEPNKIPEIVAKRRAPTNSCSSLYQPYDNPEQKKTRYFLFDGLIQCAVLTKNHIDHSQIKEFHSMQPNFCLTLVLLYFLHFRFTLLFTYF